MTTAFVYPYLKEQTVLGRRAIHFQFNELGVSIKSVKKFFQGEPVFWIIGDPPKLKGVNFIHAPRINCIAGREFDVYHKLQIVLDTPDIPDDFVWMYDDHIFLDKFNLEFIQQVVAYDYIYNLDKYLTTPSKVGPGYRKRRGSCNWRCCSKLQIAGNAENNGKRTWSKISSNSKKAMRR